MNGSDQLNSIYYISLPENFELSKNAMHIDKTIPLPVQKKDKDSPDNFNMDELTPEHSFGHTDCFGLRQNKRAFGLLQEHHKGSASQLKAGA